jgi:hypothetical protein
MTDQTPENWLLFEAAKRCGRGGITNVSIIADRYKTDAAFRALCDMIAKHEQKPVDRKLLCAREADRLYLASVLTEVEDVAVRAIELWIEGYGE